MKTGFAALDVDLGNAPGARPRPSPWQWALFAFLAWYVIWFTAESLEIHHGLGTSAYDAGLYDQGLWLLSRLKAPFVTLMGRNLFGDHTSFVLLFLAPIYRSFPDMGVLFFAQSAAIAAGAVPVFWYARKRLGDESIAALLAIAYLMHPAVGWTNLEHFHPDAFLGAFTAFAVYAALESKWRMYTVFVVLTLLVKEDAALLVIPLGIWVAFRRHRRIGLYTILGALSYTLFALFVVMQSLIGAPTLNAWRIPFGGVGGFLATAFTKPGEVWDYFRSGGRPWYLWQVTAPFAWVFLRQPEVASIGAVVIGMNILSTWDYQHAITTHYTLVALPAIALGTVFALSRLSESLRFFVAGIVVAAGVAAGGLWGTFPWSRTPHTHWMPDDPIPAAAHEILELVPDHAVVSAHPELTVHIAHREEIYMWPNPFSTFLYGDADTVLLEGRRLPAADRVEYVVLPRDMSGFVGDDLWHLAAPEFEIMASNAHWDLFRRIAPPEEDQ